ncbi:MAG: pentapeptide repeat-containing protein [Tildeniella torsiva UHER 1998/13D]|jgi:uncharacterized protein YjbI with pentapeptide repeats|nr:pentapeptide repeat-containing protein [Tildeniella torsiva UHER 1998/13D]
MANEEQVALLRQGSKVWNAWRKENSGIEIDLESAKLTGVNLSFADLRAANLEYADLRAANLTYADLSKAYLNSTNLNNADLNEANLTQARLVGAYLFSANLRSTNLREATLFYANLESADLSEARLSFADLNTSNLTFTNFKSADLSKANLNASQVLYANFTKATLTGACIADWQINSFTNLKDVKCEYVFRTYDFEAEQFLSRLPVDPGSTFAPGEFTQRFQIIASALETIDITFTEGIDWQAFFQSFQDLRASHPNEGISIQGMERKGDAFIVRLEVEAEADKAAIETEVKRRYAHQLAALEAQYRERLRLQSDEIAHHRQTQSSLLHIVQTMAEKDSISQTFHGPVGNVAGTNQGQMTAYINQNNEAISQLIAALRASAQTFPPEQKDDVLMELEDLEGDLSKPEKQEPKRIGKRLQRLIAAGTAAATLAGGAATFAGNINEFTENVFELGEKIGLSRDAVQP